MTERLIRSEMLIGSEALHKLGNSTVAIFGIGGVGTYVAEGLVRSGIGSFVLIDDDVIAESNINRQLHANYTTLGQPKVEAMKQRMLDINPQVRIIVQRAFVLYDNIEGLLTKDLTYVVDALDTVTAKIAIAMRAKELDIPLISSMGTGNKLNPMELTVDDIYNTSVCPLCKVMRKELKKRGLQSLKVVFSKEMPRTPLFGETEGREETETEIESGQILHKKRVVPGSIAFVPSVAGLIIASEVVKDIIK